MKRKIITSYIQTKKKPLKYTYSSSMEFTSNIHVVKTGKVQRVGINWVSDLKDLTVAMKKGSTS